MRYIRGVMQIGELNVKSGISLYLVCSLLCWVLTGAGNPWKCLHLNVVFSRFEKCLTRNFVVFSVNLSPFYSMLSLNIILVGFRTITSDLMWWWIDEIMSLLCIQYVLYINIQFRKAWNASWKCLLRIWLLKRCSNPVLSVIVMVNQCPTFGR